MNLLKYDTIIFDLDFTIWDGCRQKFWAKLLIPPYSVADNRIYDVLGDYIKLQNGIEEVIQKLSRMRKNIGFASIGALEDIKFDHQPSVQLLKLWGLYDYFNYPSILVYKTIDKIPLLKPSGKTLYIDDDPIQLEKAKKFHGDKLDILDRNNFVNWKDLI